MTVPQYLVRNPIMEVVIRSLGVGLVALATVAAAGLLLTRRRLFGRANARRQRVVDTLYAAGL